MILLRTILLYVLCLSVAGYAIVAYSVLPLGKLVHPEMRAVFQSHSIGISIHVFASSLALILGPLQFSRQLRIKRPDLHRWLGRLYLGVGVLAGGLAGLYMAMFAWGGFPARIGFALLAVAWLTTGWLALQSILDGDVQQHRRWMVRNFALSLAAVTLRIYLPIFTIGGISFVVSYPIISWLCWVPNLIVAELLLGRIVGGQALEGS